MSGEPTDTGISSSLSLAERYGSFAEYAASTDATPRSAATSLDVARFHAFTGELSFSTDPAVRLYLDGGVVYHAERDGDPPISTILRDMDVVESDQLERGLVRVGDVEHLGRLFDREPSIDRDAVMVVMESRTEAIVRELANRSTASVSVSAYRHHPSGLHRWFVASDQPAESHRPLSAVAQVDRSVVDELPALRATPATVEIEWSEPDPSGALPAPLPSPDALSSPAADPPGSATATDGSEHPAHEPALRPLSEFHIVWPDGTAEDAIAVDPTDDTTSVHPIDAVIAPDPVDDATTHDPVDPAGPEAAGTTAASVSLPPPATAETPTGAPPAGAPLMAPPSVDAHANPSFSIAPLEVDELPEPDAAVPDDVAAAVKRALQAIESASTGHVSVPELAVSDISLPEITVSDVAPAHTASAPAADPPPPSPPSAALVEPAPVTSDTDAAQPVEAVPTASGPGGFAPPTPDMAAEAVYARAVAAAHADASVRSEPDVADVPAAQPTDQPGPGRASVVFVDDEEPEPAADRRSALRRLISSLRPKSD